MHAAAEQKALEKTQADHEAAKKAIVAKAEALLNAGVPPPDAARIAADLQSK